MVLWSQKISVHSIVKKSLSYVKKSCCVFENEFSLSLGYLQLHACMKWFSWSAKKNPRIHMWKNIVVRVVREKNPFWFFFHDWYGRVLNVLFAWVCFQMCRLALHCIFMLYLVCCMQYVIIVNISFLIYIHFFFTTCWWTRGYYFYYSSIGKCFIHSLFVIIFYSVLWRRCRL